METATDDKASAKEKEESSERDSMGEDRNGSTPEGSQWYISSVAATELAPHEGHDYRKSSNNYQSEITFCSSRARSEYNSSDVEEHG